MSHASSMEFSIRPHKMRTIMVFIVKDSCASDMCNSSYVNWNLIVISSYSLLYVKLQRKSVFHHLALCWHRTTQDANIYHLLAILSPFIFWSVYRNIIQEKVEERKEYYDYFIAAENGLWIVLLFNKKSIALDSLWNIHKGKRLAHNPTLFITKYSLMQ